MSRADRAVHVENHFFDRLLLANLIDPAARQIHQQADIVGLVENLHLNCMVLTDQGQNVLSHCSKLPK